MIFIKYIVKIKGDRDKMIELIEFTEPFSNQIKTYYDKRPETKEIGDKFPKNKSEILQELNKVHKHNLNTTSFSSVSLKKCSHKLDPNPTYTDFDILDRVSPWDVKQNVVKAVMFPNGKGNTSKLKSENAFFKVSKEEMRAMYENMVYRLEEDAKLRNEEIRLHAPMTDDEIRMMNGFQKAKLMHYFNDREYSVDFLRELVESRDEKYKEDLEDHMM